MTSCSEQEYGCGGAEDEGEADECRATELVRLQEERDRRLFVLDKEFPDWRYKKNTMKPEKGFVGASSRPPPELSSEPSMASTPSQRPQKRPPSKLRTEVLPEEVVLPFVPDETSSSCDADWGWADSSSGDWPSLADEIAENEAAREAASVTVSWGPWAGQKGPDEEALYQSWSADEAVKETKSRTDIKEGAAATEDDSDFRVEDRTNQSPTGDLDSDKRGVSRIDEKTEQNPEKNWDKKSFGVLDTLLAVH
ncbi:hypothetical protein CBER1_05381 [Cercospora berteroae]|uniref:Uncharacterized protein n=1 Tax=Cercospora berteroae TaxID=357750 RepID=A0A2S6C706_9PEZI|nr:hypothetical protein CBER1_05381 [Cercospora berteroae]